MANNGKLLMSLGGYEIPDYFIQFDSYQAQESTEDVDSYRDAYGILHRTALEHTIAKIEFNTPYINSNKFEEVMSVIRSKYSNTTDNAHQKRINGCSIFIPEFNHYWTGDVYLTSNLQVKIYKRDGNGFLYEPVRFAFIGY